ncbi:MAG: hypothetical protein A2V98_12185 [Planctomycetes bacterium RBG_16_64_12]|nr:MAG: hypothetical protein A2V98_12185 [Planctomycetes bacterium RBG_16_64_12]
MFHRIRFAPVACASLILALFVAGCGGDGPERGAVSGKVTLDGEPLEGADVEFQPEAGSPSYGTTDRKGKYDLMYTRDKRGAMIGVHTVRITTSTTGTDGQGNQTAVPQRVPPKYNSQSELKTEVKPGRNKVDFELKQP